MVQSLLWFERCVSREKEDCFGAVKIQIQSQYQLKPGLCIVRPNMALSVCIEKADHFSPGAVEIKIQIPYLVYSLKACVHLGLSMVLSLKGCVQKKQLRCCQNQNSVTLPHLLT